MFKRGKRTLAMAMGVPLQTGNVAIVAAPPGSEVGDLATAMQLRTHDLPAQRATTDGEDPAGVNGAPHGWTIRDARGKVVFSDMPTRAAASRMLGVLAVNGAGLPLIVHGPDGLPTGERLG